MEPIYVYIAIAKDCDLLSRNNIFINGNSSGRSPHRFFIAAPLDIYNRACYSPFSSFVIGAIILNFVMFSNFAGRGRDGRALYY